MTSYDDVSNSLLWHKTFIMAKDKLQPKQIYTKEKAQHLVRVYMSVLCAVLLIGWLNIFIVNPLRTDAKEMVRPHCH